METRKIVLGQKNVADLDEELPTEPMKVNMGPSHPAMHGTIRMVLTLDGERIKEVTAFVVRVADTPDGYSQWPEYAADSDRVQSVFQRFGLPDHLD